MPITAAPPGVTTVGACVKLAISHPRGQDLVAEVVGPDGATVYRVWDRRQPVAEDYDEGYLMPRAYEVAVFNGQPVNGEWTLRVRDEAPGEAGTLPDFSLLVEYMPPESSQAAPTYPVSGAEALEVAPTGRWQEVAGRI